MSNPPKQPVSTTADRPPPRDLDPLVALAPLYADTSQSNTSKDSFEFPTITTTGQSFEMALLFGGTSAFDFELNEQRRKPSAFEADTSMPFDLESTSFAAFDAQLQSPLGLDVDGDDTPFSEYLVSPMFQDDDFLSTGDFSFPLFPQAPASAVPAPLATVQSPLLLPAPAPTPSSSASFLPTPDTPYLSSPSFSITPSPHLQQSSSKATSAPRAAAPLVDLSAPVAPRTYLLPSSTSRKRKTTLVERELAKRQCVPTETGEQDVDIPEDLVAAVAKHREMNTLSARRSRARKKQEAEERDAVNARLVSENEALKGRVAELESMLQLLGQTLVDLPAV
ncbi:hypothetical protein RQP46_006359 [Phenoliferia psychrophenolica]